MDTIVSEYFDQLIGPVLNPQKRIFVGYFLSAILVALVVQFAVAKWSPGRTLKTFFSSRVWFSSSARGDYKILLLNKLVMMGVLPRLVSRLAVATLLFHSFHIWFDGRITLWPSVPGWAIAVAFTMVLFLLDDATKYLVHRALHRWPLLWCFHQVHHSAEVLTPVTVYRTHPVEGVIFALRSVLVQAVIIASFLFFFGSRAELVAILGANAFLFLFNVAGSNLRHSHIWISYGSIVERWLISPAQHQIHHSIEDRHYDQNFGAVLAVWDRMGGSLCLADDNKPTAFGVTTGNTAPHALKTLYLDPFRNAFRITVIHASKGFAHMRASISSFSKRWPIVGAVVVALLVTVFALPASAQELNVYSHRQPFLIKPFLEAYTAKTGTKINVVFASKGLAQRLQAEGKRSPADVILTVDIARLSVYADKNLLAEVVSKTLEANVPSHLRSSQNTWFALSKRARVIVVAKRAQDALGIQRYEALADARWRGRICARPGSHIYNRALIASLINASGIDEAEKWASGVVSNLARRPQGNDRAQVKAIYEGVCDIAIINNYYFGKLKASDKPAQRKWAEAVRLIFPNQDGRGTHINISGGGVARYSKNKAEAIRFLEFLTSKEAQDLYGEINFEYPVNPAIEPSAELKSWGDFKEDQMPISRIAELAPDAQKLIDRVGW